jgi:hypothetical protein
VDCEPDGLDVGDELAENREDAVALLSLEGVGGRGLGGGTELVADDGRICARFTDVLLQVAHDVLAAVAAAGSLRQHRDEDRRVTCGYL